MITVSVYDSKPYDREYLQAASAGSPIRWNFLEFRLSRDTAIAARESEAVCVFVNDVVDRPTLEILASQGVKLVCLRCAGFNNVDLTAAKELGMHVTRVSSYSPHAVAEHAVALLMALNRKLHRAYNRVREANFSLRGLVGFDLHGKTAGILGTGNIGRCMAQILRGFGMRVLAYDVVESPEWARANGVEYADPRVIARESDVLSIHLPLTESTQRIVRKDTLDLMKPGAILINVSRGKLIDTADLIQALKSGKLGGVALDVYDGEEGVFFEDHSESVLQDDTLARLLTFPNVLITAHQAFLTKEALSAIAETTVANIAAMTQGAPFVSETHLV